MLALEEFVAGLRGRPVMVRRLRYGRHIGPARPFETKGKRSQFACPTGIAAKREECRLLTEWNDRVGDVGRGRR